MISYHTYDSKSEQYLHFDLYSPGQPLLDLSIITDGPFGAHLELNKTQVFELVQYLARIYPEMN